MAWSEFKSEIVMPPFQSYASGAPNFQNSSNFPSPGGQKVAWLLPIKKSGLIENIYFRTGTTGNTGNYFGISACPVNLTTGNPDDTQLWATDSYIPTFSGVTANNFYGPYTFTQPVSVNAGDIISFVMTQSVWVANSTITLGVADLAAAGIYIPTAYNGTAAGVWTIGTGMPNIGLEYTDGVVVGGVGIQPIADILTRNVTTTSNPRIIGNRLIPTETLRGIGMWFWADADADLTVTLYETSGSNVTSVFTATVDKDIPTAVTSQGAYIVYFNDAITLQKNQTYYITVQNSSNTTACATYTYSSYTSAAKQYILGGDVLTGVTTTTSTPTTTSDFTVEESNVAVIGFIYDAIDIPTGSGGETSHTFCC